MDDYRTVPRPDNRRRCGLLNIEDMPLVVVRRSGHGRRYAIQELYRPGSSIMLAAGDFFNFGDINNVGSAGLTVHGGTVTTPLAGAAGTGLIIGGGNTGYNKNNCGRVIMYGGLISVPRIALQNGDIALYGGTLECTADTNFIFFQNRPDNKINISGGTLKVAGTHGTEFTGYINSHRIYSARGLLGVPDTTTIPNYTTLTSSDNNMARAWNPTPEANATNVRYTRRRCQCPHYAQMERGRHQRHKPCRVFRNKRKSRQFSIWRCELHGRSK